MTAEENLLWGCSCGHRERVECLLRSGANKDCADELGETPLHKACEYGRAELVKVLIAAGADREKRTLRGRTPLHSAAGMGRDDIVRILVESGCSKDSIDDEWRTPACVAALSTNRSTAALLDFDFRACATIDDFFKMANIKQDICRRSAEARRAGIDPTDSRTCKVCKKRRIDTDIVLVPCGHSVLCGPCVQAALDSGCRCPLCHIAFRSIMNTCSF